MLWVKSFHRWYRRLNEVPILILLVRAIVVLAVVAPF